MNSIYSTPFSKATLTGVFVGFVTSLLCMIYNNVFRGSTGFSPSYFINVSSLIFIINLLFFVIGVIFYAFRHLKNGELFYIVLFVLLTVGSALLAGRIHRSDVSLINSEFHLLLVPMIIFIGIAAAFGVPFLFHNKKFEEHVL